MFRCNWASNASTSFLGVHKQQTHKIAEYRNAIPEAKLAPTNPQGNLCQLVDVQLNQIRKRKSPLVVKILEVWPEGGYGEGVGSPDG